MNLLRAGNIVDERFLAHRRRSTSIAGLAGAVVAAAVFFYKLFVLDTIDRGMFAVVLTVGVVKIALMLWYRTTD